MTDTWGTDSDPDYSIEKFYTRSDKRTQTRQTRVYLADDQLAEIARLVQGKEVPEYDTMQAFVRDAVHHRLHWVVKERVQTPESAMRMRVMNLRADAEARAGELEQYQRMIDAIGETLSRLQQVGDKAELRKQLAELELHAESLPDPWSWRLAEVLTNYQDPAA
jgi:hypothetical protein